MKETGILRRVSDKRRIHITPEFVEAIGVQDGGRVAIRCTGGEIRLLHPAATDAAGCPLRNISKQCGVIPPRNFLEAIGIWEGDMVEIRVADGAIILRNPLTVCCFCGIEAHGGVLYHDSPICARCYRKLRGLEHTEHIVPIPGER